MISVIFFALGAVLVAKIFELFDDVKTTLEDNDSPDNY